MPALVIIGAQWGDEGKGKLVDYLTSHADWAVRFQGGNNAGHTLVVNGQTTKLNLVPSGILRPRVRCLIGAGVVIDPEVFASEADKLRAAGARVDPERLTVDRDAHLIFEYHRRLDSAREEALGKSRIGTTGRGIGPAYEDRANRSGVRVAELTELDRLRPRLQTIVAERNAYLRAVLGCEVQAVFDDVWAAVERAAKVLLPYMGNGSLLLDRAIREGQRVVFEGAQGTLLDQVHGTFPYVTSANTIAGAVATGCGIGPQLVGQVVGVAKAYSTRVGQGPFPTELTDSLGAQLREAGAEYGTVTGRPRRCGWFDAFAMRRAVRLNGIDSVAITKLDVLSGVSKVKICTGYLLDGKPLEDLPSLAEELERVEPQYVELSGWSEALGQARSITELCPEAQEYLKTLARLIERPVEIVSVGPDRGATIVAPGADWLGSFVE